MTLMDRMGRMTRIERMNRTLLKLLSLLALLVPLVGGALVGAHPAEARQMDVLTARLGISAGAAIEQAPLGLEGRPLRERLPILFETANQLDVRILDASVGQGFFSEGGVLLSEKDLDLVVRGRRDRIVVMGAMLGKAFSQSVVFVWFFGRPGDGGQATAGVLLPRGAEALTPQIYQQLVTELSDGGHVRYAGQGLLFVANTGGEPDGAFLDRMERARKLLGRAGVPTRPVRCERATFVAIDRASYDQIIAGGSPGSRGSLASGGPEGARRPTSPDRRCAAAA
ncbi:MAG TPA: hypothetical protein VH257_09380 [Chloroflexota bacterium]|nr:hypothetical protein [Chloroflexota bacterium]